MARVKDFFSKNPTAWEFAKYTIFSVIGGLLELVVFMILNSVLPQKRYKQAHKLVYLCVPCRSGRTGRFYRLYRIFGDWTGHEIYYQFQKDFQIHQQYFLERRRLLPQWRLLLWSASISLCGRPLK